MNSEVKKRKKRFWAFCLAFVLMLESAMPMSVLAAEYNFENLTTNPTEINKVNIVYAGDRIVFPSSLVFCSVVYMKADDEEYEVRECTGSSFEVESYEGLFGDSNEEKCWKIKNIQYFCGGGYLELVEYPDLRSYTKSNIYYELYGGVNATSNPSTYYEGWEEITLADASKAGYTFGGWYSDAAFTTKVTSIPVTQKGDVKLYAKFTPNLISITNLQNITGVANGTAKTAAALGLPTTVTIATGDTSITTANVSWDLTNIAYDPSVLTEQSFTVKGTVTLPKGVANPNNVGLDVTIQVTVSAADIVESVQATPATGTYDSNQSVELRSSTEGADIYYTTDGSEPNRTSTKYTGAISVTGTEGQSVQTTIKAIAVKDRMQDSRVAEFTYTIQIPDTTAPIVVIWIGTDIWNQFWIPETFGLFFKNTEQVTITASDNVTTSPEIKYYLSDDRLTKEQIKADGIVWENYTAAFDINANSKKIVYAKVTDEAGNTTIVNSNGIVVYTDSVQADTSITYTKLSKEDKNFTVTLNGNTINQVTVSSTNNASLTQPEKNTDYTILENQVILKGDYIDTLPAGDYTITISYNPMGETYQESQGGNDEPATTTVNLKVEKIAGMASVTGDPGKTYDGMPVSLNFDSNNNAGNVVIEFKEQGADDTAYYTTAPKNVGNYTVRVTVKADSAGNYTEAVATKDFSITPKEVTITGTTVEKTREYDGTTTATITEYGTLTGKCGNDDLSFNNGKASYSDKNVETDKPVTFSGFTLTGQEKDNYTLIQPASVTASITQKDLMVGDVAVADKQYDGLNRAALSGTPVLVGVISEDEVSLTNGTPTFTSLAVGENIPVSFTDFAIIGADAGNYNLIQPIGIMASIYNSYTAVQNTDYTVNSNDWINTDFVVTAKEGYELSETNTADGTWKDTLTATDETASGSLTFYVRNKQTGAISNTVAENYKIDKTVPMAQINVGTNSWNQFWNDVTFGLFFKDKQTVTITADDNVSAAPEIQYYLSDKELTESEVNADDIAWETYTGAFDINTNSTKIIYAKATDDAGYVTIVNSEGVVVYKDSTPAVADIRYTYKENVNKLVAISLNGNTVKAITNGTKVLKKDTDYTVSADGTITIMAAYLDTLAASDTPYTLTVTYNPQGVEYTGTGDSPAQTTISVKVDRAQETPTTENSVKLNTGISLVWKNNKLTISWKTVSGADGYDIFATKCGKKMNAKSLLKTVKGGKSSASLTKIAGKKLSKKETYKVRIKAYKLVGGKKYYIGKSDVYHIAGKNNKKYTNAKKIKVSKKSVSLKVGKTSKIKAKIVKQSKRKKLLGKGHGPSLRYYSTNKSIATVTAKGKIKAKQKGSCYIYIKALNGVTAKVKVTVK